jgi:hypothetical protein
MNLSFGSPGGSSALQTELGHAEDAGITIVSGAGNENREEPAYYPGDSSKVLMVTALDSLDVKAPFADWNQDVFVSAPGDGVRSAFPGGEWGLASGCSFATPIVSGVAALIRAVRPTWGTRQIEDRIEYAVDPIYQIPGNQPYLDMLGSGRINARRAIESLMTSSVSDDIPTSLLSAAPNPSRGSVWFLRDSRSEAAPEGDILVVDPSGREVRRLPADGARVHWDGRDESGQPVPSGLYLYSVAGETDRRKLVVIR